MLTTLHWQVWDVSYENLTMHGVPTPIQLNQFYFAKPGDKPATMRFERIAFRNITAIGAGGGSFGSGGDTHAVVNFDCDRHYNGVNNCVRYAQCQTATIAVTDELCVFIKFFDAGKRCLAAHTVHLCRT
eukprot:SAG31_NODE_2530_length_5556_cov_2.442917_6_plen_129_part_00